MKAIAALVMLGKILLSCVVGLRLLRMETTERMAPERALGLHLLVGGVLGSTLTIAAYGTWSTGSNASWIPLSNAAGMGCSTLGNLALVFFTWRTFRRESAWGRTLAATLGLVLVVAYLGRFAGEGFVITTVPGIFHWVAYAARVASLVWVTSESISYFRVMRKRQILGLAEPLVANRFLLWSVWSAGGILASMSEPIARVVYALISGGAPETEAVVGLAQPIVLTSLLVTSLSGMLTTGALFLTFFPTEGYKRWVASRAGQAT